VDHGQGLPGVRWRRDGLPLQRQPITRKPRRDGDNHWNLPALGLQDALAGRAPFLRSQRTRLGKSAQGNDNVDASLYLKGDGVT
jgi:hypothetical protein